MVFTCGRQRIRTIQYSLTWGKDSILSTTEKNLISLRSHFSTSLLLLPTISYIVMSISRDHPPRFPASRASMMIWAILSGPYNTACTTSCPNFFGSSDLHIIELVTVVNYYYHYYYYPYHYCCCWYHYYYIIVAIINVLSIYLFLQAGKI